MEYAALGLSIVNLAFIILTFFFNRNNDTKKDSKEEKDKESKAQYDLGRMAEKLDTVGKQNDKILEKLDSLYKEVNEKIKDAITEHEKRFHNK